MILLIVLLAISVGILLYLSMALGWLVNIYFTLCVILDVILDLVCHLWIDVEKIWKRGKPVKLDDHEKRLS